MKTEYRRLVKKVMQEAFRLGGADVTISGQGPTFQCLVRMNRQGGLNVLPAMSVIDELSESQLKQLPERLLQPASHFLQTSVDIREQSNLKEVSVKMQLLTADSGRTLQKGGAEGSCREDLLEQTMLQIFSSARREMLKMG
jgi:hypothetical protein